MKIALFTQQLTETAFAHGYAALSRGFYDLGFKDQHILYLKMEPSESIPFPREVEIFSSRFNRIAVSPVWLAQYIKEAKPDVLISMPVFINVAAIIGHLLSGENHTKLIISERAILSYYLKNEKNNLRFKVLPPLLRTLYPKVDGLVANNRSVLEDFTKNLQIPIGNIPQKVIPPAIDINRINDLKKKKPNNRIRELIRNPLIVSIGRLAEEKNFDLLIRAFKQVRELIDARLIIMGDGPERVNLNKLISRIGVEEVYLPGYIDNPWSILARSEVFVLPSKKEAFGRVLVEAMACGIPVIAADSIGEGPKYILNSGENGYLVSRNDDLALADAIIELLESEDLRNRFIKKGKIRSQDFNPESVAREWIDFIDGIP